MRGKVSILGICRMKEVESSRRKKLFPPIQSFVAMGHKTKGMGGGWRRSGGRGWSSAGWEDGREMGVQNDWFTLV